MMYVHRNIHDHDEQMLNVHPGCLQAIPSAQLINDNRIDLTDISSKLRKMLA